MGQESQPQESPSVDVFVSYAREDLHFVRTLTDALRARGRTVWVDLEGLYAGEAWWPNLCRAIDAANTLVFVLTPASAASGPCHAELAHAADHGKRIVPLAWADPGDLELPAVLKEIQWLIPQPAMDLDAVVQGVIAVLDSDPVWLRGHTRWLQFALDWDRRGRPEALLLSGDYLDEAQRWLATDAPSRNPAVVSVQRELIAASERTRLLDQARSDLAHGRCTLALARLLRASDGEAGALSAPGHAMLFEGLQRLRACEPLHADEHTIENVAVDRSGRRLVAGDHSRASVWDLGSRPARRLAVVDALDGGLPLLSPDGERLLAGANGRPGLLNAATGQLLSSVEFDADAELIGGFSSDGRRFALADGSRIRLFSSMDGRQIQERSHGPTVGVHALSFHPAGTMLLTTSPERVRIWNADTLDLMWEAASGPRSSFWTAHFSDSGDWIVAARGNTRITIWRAEDGTVEATLAGARGDEFQDACFADADRGVLAFGSLEMRSWKWPDARGRGREVGSGRCVALSPRGDRVAVSSGDRSGRIVLRNIYTGALEATLGRHTDSVKALAWTPGGDHLVSGDERGLLVLWSMSTHSVHGAVETDGGAIGRLLAVPDGSGVIAAGTGVQVWRFDASLAVRRIDDRLRSVCVLPAAGLTVAIPRDDLPPAVRDGDAGELRASIEDLGPVRTCSVSPDGRWLAAIGQDDLLYVIDPATFRTGHTWPAEDAVRLAFDAAGRRLLASGSERCAVWDLERQAAVVTFGDESLGAHASALSPDGRRLCIAETRYHASGQVRRATGHGVRILNVENGATEVWIQWGDDPEDLDCSVVSFSPDSSTILVCRNSDGAVGLFDAATGNIVRTVGDEEMRYGFAAWSADGGAVIASGADGVEIWKSSDGVRITRFDRSTNVRRIAYSHDGALAATIDSHAVWVWDCASWTPLANLCDGIDRFPQSAVFSADSQGLIIIESDGQAAWYPVGRTALREAARPWAATALT